MSMSELTPYEEEVCKGYDCKVYYEQDIFSNPIEEWDHPKTFGIDLSNHRDYSSYGESMPVDMAELMDYLSRPETHVEPETNHREMREEWKESGGEANCSFGQFEADYESEDMYQWEGDEEYRDFIRNYYFMPVNMYCHGMCTISVTSGYPFDCPWDSGIAGFTYIKRSVVIEEGLYKAHAEMSEDRIRECGEKFLESQVALLDAWMNGRVFWWAVTQEGEILESCSGYYDYDGAKYAMEEAKATAERLYEDQQEQLGSFVSKRRSLLKEMLRQHTPMYARVMMLSKFDEDIAEYTSRGVELAV